MLFGGCASVAATPSAPASATPARPSGITVALGIYSGRPDPSWELTEAQSAEFERLLDALPTASGDPPQGGLGYHGFYLIITRPGEAPLSLFAFRGAVTSLESGPRTYWQDSERTIEAYLLDTGRPHLTPNEIAAVEADLGTTQ